MSIVRVLAAGLLALLVAGCGFVETTPPAPTPADFQGIAGQLAKRGIHVDRIVSGDAGCTDKTLAPTAIAFDASGLDQTATTRVYIYVFSSRATYERLRPTVDACARAYVNDPDAYESVGQSPYVLAGQGPWGARFEAAIQAGLLEAAGTGE